jgi:hypothetical protein
VADCEHARIGLQRLDISADLVDSNAVVTAAALKENALALYWGGARKSSSG